MAEVYFRRANASDLGAVVALLADDPLGRTREDPSLPLDPRYLAAFGAIEADPNQFLAVAMAQERVVGTLHLTFVPGIARLGAWRGQLEGVRINSEGRNAGLGHQMMLWAISECRRRGCYLVQLTTDKERPDTHRFYERLGFTPSHVGYKLVL